MQRGARAQQAAQAACSCAVAPPAEKRASLAPFCGQLQESFVAGLLASQARVAWCLGVAQPAGQVVHAKNGWRPVSSSQGLLNAPGNFDFFVAGKGELESRSVLGFAGELVWGQHVVGMWGSAARRVRGTCLATTQM